MDTVPIQRPTSFMKGSTIGSHDVFNRTTARSEVTSATIASNAYTFAYDDIGNHTASSENSVSTIYDANSLNQYSEISVPSVQSVENLSYDLDGNLLTNGIWSYTWDCENRLVAAFSNSVCVVSNAYDHASRRVQKFTPSATHTFVYDGWNLIQETIQNQQSTITNHFVWGRDLSGALQGAGGVGGLLAVQLDGTWYFPLFDANGNITAYVDENGVTAASYTYDAFGDTMAQSGPMPNAFRHRFSTKYHDPETGLYYYGYRFYSPSLHHWLNRDPIEEQGGDNLYGFVGNNPIDRYDPFGLAFGITYVQFEGLLGHGWIRTGGFQTYDITTMFEQTITYEGTTYKVNSATAVLPVGIGFYPSVAITPLQSLRGVPGQWKYEQEKELVALNAKDMLKQWDTELKSRRWLGLRAAIFKYGTAKDKCCKNATRNDVLGCIMDYRDKHLRATYRLPFLSCRSRAKDALEACCLNVGNRMPTTVGAVRINATPVEGTP